MNTFFMEDFFYPTNKDKIVTSNDFSYLINIVNNITNYKNITIKGYNGSNEKVSIPSEIEGKKVVRIAKGAFSDHPNITEITIPSSIEVIEKAAFCGCSSLKEIKVAKGNNKFVSTDGILFNRIQTEIICYPSGKTESSYTVPSYINYLWESAFCCCDALTEIIIPHSVQGICEDESSDSINIPSFLGKIQNTAFSNCSSLKEIKVSPDNQNFVDIDGVLFNKTQTEILCYPSGKTESVYTIPSSVKKIGIVTFKNCSSLTEITLPSSTEIIEPKAFYGCSSLQKVNVSPENQNFFSENGILFNKSQTELLYYPDNKKDSVFSIPDFVTKINKGAFDNCPHLKKIVFASSITSINPLSFPDCKTITSVSIPSSVETIEPYSFKNHFSLKEIKVSPENQNFMDIDGVLFNKSQTEIICYPIAKIESVYNIPSSVKSIRESTFSGCKNLTKITIPPSVESIGSSAFLECDALITITIPSSVKNIGEYAFDKCSSLKEIKVSPENQNFVDIDGVLFNKSQTDILCYPIGKTESIYAIPPSVKNISKAMFSGCQALTEITIPSSVENIEDHAFSHCKALTTITLPLSVTSIDKWAFSHCSKLSELILPESLKNIGEGAFAYCSSLTEVNIPSSVISIANFAFVSCSSLAEITIPSSLKCIGNESFNLCLPFVKINLPPSIKNIRNWGLLEDYPIPLKI